MSATIATLIPEAADEFRTVFNSVAKYVGVLDTKISLTYYTTNKKKRRHGSCWKQDASRVYARTTDSAGKKKLLSKRERDLLTKAVDIAYGSRNLEAVDVGSWNDGYTVI